MAKRIVVKVGGVDKVKMMLAKKQEELNRNANRAVDEIATFIQEDAITNAPSMGSDIPLSPVLKKDGTMSSGNSMPLKYNLKSLVNKKLNPSDMTGEVFIDGDEDGVKMSAYVNFGTGDDASAYLASLDQEWRDMAQEFYVDGKGRILHIPYFTDAAFKGQDNAISIVKRNIEQ